MASETLGRAYVLSGDGAARLAEMDAHGSAPMASPGFRSKLGDSAHTHARLSSLEKLVRAHAA